MYKFVISFIEKMRSFVSLYFKKEFTIKDCLNQLLI